MHSPYKTGIPAAPADAMRAGRLVALALLAALGIAVLAAAALPPLIGAAPADVLNGLTRPEAMSCRST